MYMDDAREYACTQVYVSNEMCSRCREVGSRRTPVKTNFPAPESRNNIYVETTIVTSTVSICQSGEKWLHQNRKSDNSAHW